VGNIKIYLREIWGGIKWLDLVQDRDQCRALATTVTNLRFPENSEKFMSGCASFAKNVQFLEVSKLISYVYLSIDSSYHQYWSVISW
jgi:hypothetical protein